jgi:hypothetical protein
MASLLPKSPTPNGGLSSFFSSPHQITLIYPPMAPFPTFDKTSAAIAPLPATGPTINSFMVPRASLGSPSWKISYKAVSHRLDMAEGGFYLYLLFLNRFLISSLIIVFLTLLSRVTPILSTRNNKKGHFLVPESWIVMVRKMGFRPLPEVGAGNEQRTRVIQQKSYPIDTKNAEISNVQMWPSNCPTWSDSGKWTWTRVNGSPWSRPSTPSPIKPAIPELLAFWVLFRHPFPKELDGRSTESYCRIFPGPRYPLERVPGSCFWSLFGSTLNFQSICRVSESVRPRERPLLDPRKFEFFGRAKAILGHFPTSEGETKTGSVFCN